MHSLLTLESIQTIPAPANIDPKQVSLSQSGFTVPARERDAQLRKVSVPLFKLEPALRAVVGDSLQLGGFDEPSGSGLTPPASPIQGRSTFESSSRPAASSNRSLPPSTATQLSQVLLLSSSSAWSLTTTPALSLALQVLDSAPSSPSLLLEALGPLMMNAATVGEQDDAAVRFVHQKVFLRGLRDARFGGFTSESTSGDADQETLGPEQAELWALAGGDYRLVLRLFVEMRPILAALVTGKDDVPSVEAGLAEEWQELWDIDEISECAWPGLDHKPAAFLTFSTSARSPCPSETQLRAPSGAKHRGGTGSAGDAQSSAGPGASDAPCDTHL